MRSNSVRSVLIIIGFLYLSAYVAVVRAETPVSKAKIDRTAIASKKNTKASISNKPGLQPPALAFQFPFIFVGLIGVKPGDWNVCLTKDGHYYVVGKGDLLEEKYRIESVDSNQVQVTDLPGKRSATVVYETITRPYTPETTTKAYASTESTSPPEQVENAPTHSEKQDSPMSMAQDSKLMEKVEATMNTAGQSPPTEMPVSTSNIEAQGFNYNNSVPSIVAAQMRAFSAPMKMPVSVNSAPVSMPNK